jgi:branched-chain amino acid transport system permease protein
MVIFSVLLIAIIIFRREGIMGTREFSWNWFFPARRTPGDTSEEGGRGQ